MLALNSRNDLAEHGYTRIWRIFADS